jgi:hypothetical protein
MQQVITQSTELSRPRTATSDPGASLLVAVIGLVVVAAVSLGLVLLTSRVFGWGVQT